MGYALLGHGGLELAAGGYPEGMGVIAIDAGTTLQVYTDTGQTLMTADDGSSYELFSQLQAPWGAMDSTNVTYNLELTENDEDLALEQNEPGFFARVLDPHVPLLAGRELPSPALLCTGDPQSCPTDPRMVSGEIPGPRAHTCDGILGTYKGELLWLACTVVYTKDAAVDDVVTAARGDAPEGAVLGTDPDSATAQYLAAWYENERVRPDDLGELFDELDEDIKQALLADDHIREWNEAR